MSPYSKIKETYFTNPSKTLIYIVLFFLFIPTINLAQNNLPNRGNNAFPEKIYLQLDRKVYTLRNTIWFKCIVSDAYSHALTTKSGILHVELIGPGENIIEKKTLKLDNGIGEGSFKLKGSLKEGWYLIRAYTQWNTNFEKDFFFREYIQVFGTAKKNVESPISNITLVKNAQGNDQLQAQFEPFSIDSTHRGKLTVHISTPEQTDTLSLKPGADKKYKLSHLLQKEYPELTLGMRTKNKQEHSKTIVLDDQYVSLDFFPESGKMVHGFPTKIGIKALNNLKKGIPVEGVIMDGEHTVITKFKTNAVGLGSFRLSQVVPGKSYIAKITSGVPSTISRRYPLPESVPEGNILLIKKYGQKLRLDVLSNYLKNDNVYLQVSFRGLEHYWAKLVLNDGKAALLLPKDKFPEGIIAFTLLDSSMQPMAERRYFNERPETRLNIVLATDRKNYDQRERTQLNIKTTDAKGNPIPANTSVLVINKAQLHAVQRQKNNILSHFLLDSELEGEIERIGHYFNSNETKEDDLDALMLTNGSRDYHYKKSYAYPQIEIEKNLSIQGRVKIPFHQKKKRKMELTLLTFGDRPGFQLHTTDSLGRFRFDLNDAYGDALKYVIQSTKENGKKAPYDFIMTQQKQPSVVFKDQPVLHTPDSIVQHIIEKDIQRGKVREALEIASGNIALDEVVVEAQRLTPQRKKVLERYGEAEVIIDGKEIEKKEPKWSYGLFSVLLYNFQDKVRVDRDNRGRLSVSMYGVDETLIVVDGIPVQSYHYDQITDIPPSEIKSFELIECAKNFRILFSEVRDVPPPLPGEIPCGGVIAIYTHAGKGLFSAFKTVGMHRGKLPAFSKPEKYKGPDYGKLKPEEATGPDLRALVHWDPILRTDGNGQATSYFYNADNVGEMVIVVEAISENGQIGYQEIPYTVQGQEREILIKDKVE